MKKLFFILCLLFPLTTLASGHGGGEEVAPVSSISYYDLSPEIVTNYAATGKKNGYIRVKVQIMVETPSDKEIVGYHASTLRDIVISTLNRSQADTIKSSDGRNSILEDCKNQMDAFFQKEEGRKLIKELLFTNYIYE